MTTQNIYSMTDVWDDVGTTFKGIGLNVTDTASASGSLLMDLQVGGASKVSVTKGGEIFLPQAGGNGAGLIAGGSSFANARAYIGQYGIRLYSTGEYNWSSGTNLNALDLALTRDAADTLAQRRSTNPQAFRVYNTYTDASNYERGFVRWSSNVLEIGAEAAGTGTARTVRVKSSATVIVENHLSPSVNTFSLGASTPWNNLFLNNNIYIGGFHQLTEMTAPSAPAENGVRIYAEDDGTGKTRLMALFATGAAQQIALEP